ncbi:MAG: hypothetical protein ACYTGL_06290 [Planctomycetota bacterium]
MFPQLAVALITAVVCLVSTTIVLAGGADASGREDDIRLTVDWRWAGCTQGGYYPIRVSLQNAGRVRTIDVAFESTMAGVPDVTRRVVIDQNASSTFSLLVPMVGENSFGQLRVYANGQELTSLRNPVTLPSMGWSDSPFATLVIADSPVDFSEYEAAVTSLLGSSGYGQQASDHQHVEPVRLPDSWLAYSGVDLVVTSVETLAALDALPRKAILDWMLTGGCLAVFSERETGVTLQTLSQLLNRNVSIGRDDWQPITTRFRRTIARVDADEHGHSTSTTSGSSENFNWPESDDTLRIRKYGLGRIVALPEKPFEGTYQDWAWMLSGIQFRQQRVATRLGVSGRAANDEFLHFLIPGVRGVPVIAFAVVISVFALLIGPVNYYVLARRKRQGFLVLTIPAIALISSLSMFAYSFVAHGVAVRSRVRSVTWIDQGSQSAISMARIAWFAGFAPSNGMTFSPSTAVVPIWHSESRFGNGRVDWTESQNLATGFLRSRTRTQALTTTVRDERGRLTVASNSSGSGSTQNLNVTSGLEWPLEAVIVWDDEGNAYGGGKLEPGQAASLPPLTDDVRESFRSLLQRSAPQMPAELTVPSNDFFGGRSAWMHGSTNYSVSQGQMERTVDDIKRAIEPVNGQMSRRYVAIAAEPPGLEFGTEVEIVDGWHLVIGTY